MLVFPFARFLQRLASVDEEPPFLGELDLGGGPFKPSLQKVLERRVTFTESQEFFLVAYVEQILAYCHGGDDHFL
jgi:hypothetical protein